MKRGEESGPSKAEPGAARRAEDGLVPAAPRLPAGLGCGEAAFPRHTQGRGTRGPSGSCPMVQHPWRVLPDPSREAQSRSRAGLFQPSEESLGLVLLGFFPWKKADESKQSFFTGMCLTLFKKFCSKRRSKRMLPSCPMPPLLPCQPCPAELPAPWGHGEGGQGRGPVPSWLCQQPTGPGTGRGAGGGWLPPDVVLIRNFWNKNEQVKHKTVSLTALYTSCECCYFD